MIGIFDSGYGGLTILNKIRQLLPEYDYLYLGDNARAPYGTRSFDVIYEYTLQAVNYLHEQGCNGPVSQALDKLDKHLNEKAHQVGANE